MSHVFDVAYFSKQDEMDMLLRMQEEVLKTVVKYVPVAIRTLDDYEARSNLMWASSWALNGFLDDGLSQDTVCHSMEHELSAFYDITHGHGLRSRPRAGFHMFLIRMKRLLRGLRGSA